MLIDWYTLAGMDTEYTDHTPHREEPDGPYYCTRCDVVQVADEGIMCDDCRAEYEAEHAEELARGQARMLAQIADTFAGGEP